MSDFFLPLCVKVPENPPVNVSGALNGTDVLVTWEEPPGKLNGELQGYRVEYSTPVTHQVSLGRPQLNARRDAVRHLH